MMHHPEVRDGSLDERHVKERERKRDGRVKIVLGGDGGVQVF